MWFGPVTVFSRLFRAASAEYARLRQEQPLPVPWPVNPCHVILTKKPDSLKWSGDRPLKSPLGEARPGDAGGIVISPSAVWAQPQHDARYGHRLFGFRKPPGIRTLRCDPAETICLTDRTSFWGGTPSEDDQRLQKQPAVARSSKRTWLNHARPTEVGPVKSPCGKSPQIRNGKRPCGRFTAVRRAHCRRR